MPNDNTTYSTGTDEQRERYDLLKKQWDKVDEPKPAFSDCWMVQVTGETGITMWLGIEADGYCHS